MRGRKCKKLREIGIIAGVVDDVKRNFKKGMIKNGKIKESIELAEKKKINSVRYGELTKLAME